MFVSELNESPSSYEHYVDSKRI